MADIDYTYTEQTTAQTSSSTSWTDITGCTISSDDLTATKKYLIFVCAQFKGTDSDQNPKLRLVHGSTPTVFDGSTLIQESPYGKSWQPYTYFTVWTAVASEDVTLQFAASNVSDTVSVDNVGMVAINLSDDLTEDTDWFYDENTTSTQLTASPTWLDGASVTFTPSGSGDWLVLSSALHELSSSGIQYMSRVNAAGDVTDTAPLLSIEREDSDDQLLHTVGRVYSLTDTENTFKEQSACDDTTGSSDNRLRSAVFALNLDMFAVHSFTYTAATIDCSETDYATEAATMSHTPTSQGDSFVFGQAIHRTVLADRYAKARVQVDGSDLVPGVTTHAYTQSERYDATDVGPAIQYVAVENMTAASHTIDLDASVQSSGTGRGVSDRLLVAFTMELAAVGNTEEVTLSDSFTFADDAVTTGVGVPITHTRSMAESFTFSDATYEHREIDHTIGGTGDTDFYDAVTYLTKDAGEGGSQIIIRSIPTLLDFTEGIETAFTDADDVGKERGRSPDDTFTFADQAPRAMEFTRTPQAEFGFIDSYVDLLTLTIWHKLRPYDETWPSVTEDTISWTGVSEGVATWTAVTEDAKTWGNEGKDSKTWSSVNEETDDP